MTIKPPDSMVVMPMSVSDMDRNTRSTRTPGKTARRDQGFTLVEMLLVVSLITILIALLLPALGNAKGISRRVQCQSNLNNLGQSVYQYSTDWYHKIFPYDNATGLHYDTFWMTLLEEYHNDFDEMRLCPETIMDQAGQSLAYAPGWGTVEVGWGQPWVTNGWGFLGTNYGSYVWNSWMHSGRTAHKQGVSVNLQDDQKHWKNLKAVKIPSTTPMLTDGTWVDTWFQNNPNGAISSPPANLFSVNSAAGRVCVSRHDRGVIHVMADGSTKWTQLEDLWQLTWNTESQPMAPPFDLPEQ